MKIFIDTWGFKALIDKSEPKHKYVRNLFEDIWKNKWIIFTSDYILDEAITLISTKIGVEKVKELINSIDKDYQSGFLKLLWVNEQTFEKAKQLRFKYTDKPDISFTDFTTMVIMSENKITDIITDDTHFKKVGMNFNLLCD